MKQKKNKKLIWQLATIGTVCLTIPLGVVLSSCASKHNNENNNSTIIDGSPSVPNIPNNHPNNEKPSSPTPPNNEEQPSPLPSPTPPTIEIKPTLNSVEVQKQMLYDKNINYSLSYYDTKIIFDLNGNILPDSLAKLTIKDGFIFSDKEMTNLIAIDPKIATNGIVTIPDTVKKITGYIAMIPDTAGVDPSQSLDDRNYNSIPVGAFQLLEIIRKGTTEVNPIALVNGYENVKTINFASNSQLEMIGAMAFMNCSNLETINLPNSCYAIGSMAFMNCNNLVNINLKNIKYIGDGAFNCCFIQSLVKNTLPLKSILLDLSSAKTIGVGAFDTYVWYDINNMTQIPSGSQDLSSNVVKYKINESCIKDAKFGLEIPKISKYAFNGTGINPEF